MINKDKQIRLGGIIFSLVVHAVLFVQFSHNAMSRQAQAPMMAARISLNLLPPLKKTQQQTKEFKPEKKIKQTRKKTVKENKIIHPVHEQAVATKLAQKIKRQQVENAVLVQQQYFATLLTHIEGYKYYPRSARQRGVEGSIQVSFRLLADGSISELVAKGHSLMLRRSAKRSVIAALPFPVCPPEIICPTQVNYAMQFKLH